MNIYSNNRRIVIKNGWNIPLIIGTICTIAFIIVCATSKLWLPDDRAVIKRNNGNTIAFMRNVLYTPNDFYYDKEKNLIEINLIEKQSIDNGEDYNINYTVKSDNYEELPYFVSRGSCKVIDSDPLHCEINVLIQAVVPNDFYFIEVKTSQLDNKVDTIQVDYRNLQPKEIIEKGENYYENLEYEEEQLNMLKGSYEKLSDEEKNANTELMHQIEEKENLIEGLRK